MSARPLLFRGAAHGAGNSTSVLGGVCFGTVPPAAMAATAVMVPLPTCPGSPVQAEAWTAAGPVTTGIHGPVRYATDGELLFGSVQIDEMAVCDGLQPCAQRAYEAIFAALDASAYPYPLRFWNYVPRINEVDRGLERYRQFNVGRQQAFLAAGRSPFDGAPAASAVGSRSGPLSIHFLAARRPPTALENPRQVSAYRYPPQYGPRAPTFSRGVLYDAGPHLPLLFVSGTAAIVGHRSLHPHDVAAQTHETLLNLRTMVQVANARLGRQDFALERLFCTLYVRRAEDTATVRAIFEAAVGAHAPAARAAIYVEADICRTELSVEIEATGCITA